MKKTYFKSREGYRPTISQLMYQTLRCWTDKHIWITNTIVEFGEEIGELKECEHCKETIHTYNLLK